jgi:polysaccharide biosynthesis transport protein
MAIEDYWKVVRKWWWLILASTLVATASSAYSLSKEPRIYEATTTVIVGQSLEKANPTYSDFSIGQQLAQTYVNMVRRQPVLQGAAEALDLGFVPWDGNVSANIVPGTQLMEIRVRDTSAERARALADEIARQLILQTPSNPNENDSRRTFVEEQLQTLERNIELTEEEIAEEQARLDAANSARAIQQYQTNIEALEQKLTSYQSNYANLLQTSQEATNYISVIESASLPTTPISPNVPETLVLAAAIGASLAVGGALLIEFIDDTLKTPDEVEKLTDLPVLATIADMQKGKGEGKLVTDRYPQSPITESFRALRTSLDYYSVDNPIRTLAVVSAGPAEGKSLILANLAIVMAQAGRRVAIVDADMRRPMQHKIFGLVNDHGLSDAIIATGADLSVYNHELSANKLAMREANASRLDLSVGRQPIEMGTLHIVTTGPCPPNPADLIASNRMKALIGELQKQADVVLFDTPPVMLVTDAIVLSRLVDGVLVLIDAGHTKRSAARKAIEKLHQVDANLLGVVLNRVSRRGDSYYSYSYYQSQEKG